MDTPRLSATTRRQLVRSNSLIETSLDAGKLPPQAPEIEQAILGALMLSQKAVAQVVDLLLPETFYVDPHARIYSAISELYAEGIDANILSVTMRLKKKGELDIVGGPYYISQLSNKVAGEANLQHLSLIHI